MKLIEKFIKPATAALMLVPSNAPVATTGAKVLAAATALTTAVIVTPTGVEAGGRKGGHKGGGKGGPKGGKPGGGKPGGGKPGGGGDTPGGGGDTPGGGGDTPGGGGDTPGGGGDTPGGGGDTPGGGGDTPGGGGDTPGGGGDTPEGPGEETPAATTNLEKGEAPEGRCEGTITMRTDELGKAVILANGSKPTISISYNDVSTGKFSSNAPQLSGVSATYTGTENNFKDCLEATMRHFIDTTGLGEKHDGTMNANAPLVRKRTLRF